MTRSQRLAAALSAVTLIGSAVGIQLGKGAASEIDPRYFEPLPVATPFVPSAPTPARASYAAASDFPEDWTSDRSTWRRGGCPDCSDADPMPQRIAAEPAGTADEEPALTYAPDLERETEWRRIAVYSSYPVDDEEEPAEERELEEEEMEEEWAGSLASATALP